MTGGRGVQGFLGSGLALSLAIVAVGPVLILAFILVPLWTRLSDANAALTQADLDLNWLASQATLHPPINAPRQADLPDSVDLERILSQTGLREQLSRMANQPEGRIALSLDNAEFQRLIEFLHVLETEFGNPVREISMGQGKPGYASVTLVVQGSDR